MPADEGTDTEDWSAAVEEGLEGPAGKVTVMRVDIVGPGMAGEDPGPKVAGKGVGWG